MRQEASPVTGRPMALVAEQDTAVYRGESIGYVHLALRCEDSGEQYTTDRLDEINENQVYKAYNDRLRRQGASASKPEAPMTISDMAALRAFLDTSRSTIGEDAYRRIKERLFGTL